MFRLCFSYVRSMLRIGKTDVATHVFREWVLIGWALRSLESAKVPDCAVGFPGFLVSAAHPKAFEFMEELGDINTIDRKEPRLQRERLPLKNPVVVGLSP